jgi:hypothetical protein
MLIYGGEVRRPYVVCRLLVARFCAFGGDKRW